MKVSERSVGDIEELARRARAETRAIQRDRYRAVLMALDGRYRDFPLGLVALPTVGYALAALAGVPMDRARRREDVFLAVAAAWLAVAVVVQEMGASPVAWLWLGLHGLVAAAVLVPRGRGTAAQ